MDALWLAILIYSLGLAVVLQLRPRLMFHENGSWKEFGYQRDSRHTLFPFWLFAISWAFVSYAAAAAASWVFSAGAGAGAAAAAASPAALSALEFDGENVRAAPPPSMFDGEPDADTDVDADTGDGNNGSDNMSYATPVSRMSRNSSVNSGGRRKPRAGYYVLDPASQKSGLRRYIFYGTNRP